MSNVVKEAVKALIEQELAEANKKFPMFNSNHEAYAVFLEEVEETMEEATTLKDLTKEIWWHTKDNSEAWAMHDEYTLAYETGINLAVEAIQAAAMARKAILSNVDMKKYEKKNEEGGDL